MEKVSVSRNLLVGIVVVALAALLAVAYLLGRASGAGGAAGPAPGIADSSSRVLSRAGEPPPSPPGPATAPVPALEGPLPESAAPGRSTPREVATPPPTEPIPATAPVVAPRGGPDPGRAAVADYLDAVDRIQPEMAAGSPESLAGELASALANGDASGLDGMIGEMSKAKERLAALTPPAPCAAHHRESLASLDEGLELLRSLGTAVTSPDPATRLAEAASRATSLRSRAEALQREETALRQRYGLAR